MKKFMMAVLVVLAMSFASCTGNACGAGTDDTTDTTEAVVDSLGVDSLTVDTLAVDSVPETEVAL